MEAAEVEICTLKPILPSSFTTAYIVIFLNLFAENAQFFSPLLSLPLNERIFPLSVLRFEKLNLRPLLLNDV